MKTRLIKFLSLLFCVTICFTACDKGEVTLTDFEQHIVGDWKYETVGFIIEGQEVSLEQFVKLFGIPDGAEAEFDEEMIFGELSISFNDNHEGKVYSDNSEDSDSFTWKLIADNQVKITDKSNPMNTMIFVESGNSIYFEVDAEELGLDDDDQLFEMMRTYLKKE
ncbi:hypothetical protein [Ancylomarina sp.]|uniref:hypothetical protein n=1 Tax=Ancylomarina sp. TaxID=1970196 RepID=UPI003566146D